MRRVSLLSGLLLIPAFALTIAATGCGKKSPSPTVEGTTTSSPMVKASDRKPIEGDLVGVLEGKVTYNGTPPVLPAPPELTGNPKQCLEGATDHEKIAQEWIVGPNKEVANVLVYLKPAKDKYFKYDSKLKPEDKFIDQPHCAFDPHVQVVFPSYWDGKAYQKTGQVFKVKNSAPFAHNSNYSQAGVEGGPTGNPTLESKDATGPIYFVPSYAAAGKVTCGIHKYMTAYVWAFDHPYAAVSKLDGSFKIENIPAGVALDVWYWHEALGHNQLKSVTFTKDKKESVEISVKAK